MTGKTSLAFLAERWEDCFNIECSFFPALSHRSQCVPISPGYFHICTTPCGVVEIFGYLPWVSPTATHMAVLRTATQVAGGDNKVNFVATNHAYITVRTFSFTCNS